MSQDKRTELIHHAYVPPDGFGSVAPGVHKASTVIFPNVAALQAELDRQSKRLRMLDATIQAANWTTDIDV